MIQKIYYLERRDNMNQKDIHEVYKNDNFLYAIRYTMELFGGKWKLPILCILISGDPVRFSTIKRKLTGITNMMLSQSLKDLELKRMVHREQFNEVPLRVEYKLTPKGKDILKALGNLAEWGADVLGKETGCTAYCGK